MPSLYGPRWLNQNIYYVSICIDNTFFVEVQYDVENKESDTYIFLDIFCLHSFIRGIRRIESAKEQSENIMNQSPHFDVSVFLEILNK